MVEKNKTNLEELLKLKRAERPDDADWERFDAELHRKLLRSLVKESFSDRLVSCLASRTFAGFSISATAIAAVAAIAVAPSYFSSTSADSVPFAVSEGVSKVSLPNVGTSYAQNEISVGGDGGQSFVSAQIDAEESPSLRYVANGVGDSFVSGVVF